jgi:hypothetical protein
MNDSFTAFGTGTPIPRIAEQSDAVKVLFANILSVIGMA